MSKSIRKSFIFSPCPWPDIKLSPPAFRLATPQHASPSARNDKRSVSRSARFIQGIFSSLTNCFFLRPRVFQFFTVFAPELSTHFAVLFLPFAKAVLNPVYSPVDLWIWLHPSSRASSRMMTLRLCFTSSISLIISSFCCSTIESVADVTEV